MSFKDVLKDLRFDSPILIFGFASGEYLDDLTTLICLKNQVYIFEPDFKEFEKFKDTLKDNIHLISCQDDNLKETISNIVTRKNFLYTEIQLYGDYPTLYKKDFETFISIIDEVFSGCRISLATDDNFKTIILKNIMSNLKNLNNTYKFDNYISKFKNIPSIVVSAGPSLDKNIETLVKYRDKLDKFLIIAGNRTLEPLLKNSITPDLVLSIDPQSVTYDMLENCLNSNIPLIFCEKTYSKILDDYKGLKIGISQGVLNNIPTLEHLIVSFTGGSIAHVATDIAFLLGCNPIVFIGQDLGYTNKQGHAKIAENKIDLDIDFDACIIEKDVFNNDIKTSGILNFYRKNLEELICIYKAENPDLQLINSSYGVAIDGSPFLELSEVLKKDYSSVKKIDFYADKEAFNIDYPKFKDGLINFLEDSLKKVRLSSDICDEFLTTPPSKQIYKFSIVLKTIDDFMNDRHICFIDSYVIIFLIYIKEKLFKMKAAEYKSLSSDIVYQSMIFKNYMFELEGLLTEILDVVNKQ